MRAYLAKQLLCVLVFLFAHGSLLINLTLLYHIDARSEISLQISGERFLTITMAISFTPNTNIKEVEVEGFGKVKVRPYGAGEELQIAKNFRELDALQAKAEKLLADGKANYDGDESKLPDTFKDEFEKIQDRVRDLSTELNDLIKSTITSEEAGVADRIFNELPMTEIRRLITTALRKEADAETE